MAEDKKNHTQLRFGITKPATSKVGETISGPERFRSYINKNRVFSSSYIASMERERGAARDAAPQSAHGDQQSDNDL